ncbi:MAG: porin [Bacteroidota bacterium]|nr:porin [Bacteroidota bacterium]
MKTIAVLLLLLDFAGPTVAQQPEQNKFSWTISFETYYLYDFNKPASKQLPGYLYSHSKNNQFSINYALLDVHYIDSSMHVNLGLISGDYSQRNYSVEPETYRHLFEANIGFQIWNRLWIDAGIMSSHIGLESAITYDNLTLTHSIMAHNSPFYETGIKLSYSTGNWILAFLILNGWQNINDNNNNKAIGAQVQWKPSDKLLLNSSSFIGDGTNLPDSLSVTRYFHDFYFTYSLTNEISLAGTYDIGIQQKSQGASDYYTWWGSALVLKYKFNNNLSVSARGEYFDDKNQVIVKTATLDGFQVSGLSINLDYLAKGNILLRLEAKHLNSKDNLFQKDKSLTDSCNMLISSIAVKL